MISIMLEGKPRVSRPDKPANCLRAITQARRRQRTWGKSIRLAAASSRLSKPTHAAAASSRDRGWPH